jgi:hypothetical protein
MALPGPWPSSVVRLVLSDTGADSVEMRGETNNMGSVLYPFLGNAVEDNFLVGPDSGVVCGNVLAWFF